jgi:hypothetical protein
MRQQKTGRKNGAFAGALDGCKTARRKEQWVTVRLLCVNSELQVNTSASRWPTLHEKGERRFMKQWFIEAASGTGQARQNCQLYKQREEKLSSFQHNFIRPGEVKCAAKICFIMKQKRQNRMRQ